MVIAIKNFICMMSFIFVLCFFSPNEKLIENEIAKKNNSTCLDRKPVFRIKKQQQQLNNKKNHRFHT